jgi:hypothetical protein
MSCGKLCWLAVAGTAFIIGSGTAQAQGVSGTSLGAPAPGQLAASLDVGASWVQFAHAEYGNYRTGSGGAILGDIIDNRARRAALAPEGAVAWGVPGGLSGNPAEVFGRLAYYNVTADQTVVVPVGQSYFAPFVAPSMQNGTIGLGASGDGLRNLSIDRRLTSFDGSFGVRTHVRAGNGTVSPMVEFGYQRLNQRDDLTSAYPGDPAGAVINTASKLNTDYFRVGIGVGGVQPLTQTVSAFAILSGSLDVLVSRFNGSTAAIDFGGDPQTAVASDRDTRVSGRAQLRGGLAFAVAPNLIVTVAGQVQFIGALPRVIYPQTSTPSPGAPGFVGPTTAQIGTDSQLIAGVSVGATARF